MRFPSQERFLQYCVAKRRTYLRLLFERRNPRGFFDLWKGELDLLRGGFEVTGASTDERAALARETRWLLLQDLHQVVRSAVPDFAPVPPSVIETLPGAMHQVRVARSMLIAGESGVGKEQLAILLHVLAGRPGALVRVAAAELGKSGSAPTRQLMPERGSVFISEIERVEGSAQEELLAFLNGEARRRDLLFFVSTCAEPRGLVAAHGLRRDLFVRVSQTEVRLPALRTRPADVPAYVGDVLFDLVRVPPERLGTLRDEAQELGERWRAVLRGPASAAYDFFSEALSYVMWREKKRLAARALAEPAWQRVVQAPPGAGNYRGLCERVAEAFADRRSGSAARQQSTDEPPDEPTPAPSPGVERAVRRRAPAAGGDAPAGVPVPTALSRDQLLRLYYEALIAEERGDLRRVAARAGRRLRSLHAELARLGVRLSREIARPEHSGGA